jgi:hypothetical protein
MPGFKAAGRPRGVMAGVVAGRPRGVIAGVVGPLAVVTQVETV